MSFKYQRTIKVLGQDVNVWRYYQNNYPFGKRIELEWHWNKQEFKDKDRLKRAIKKHLAEAGK